MHPSRRHLLNALMLGGTGLALARNPVEAQVTQAFLFAFAVHDLARVRWNATQGRQRQPVNALGHSRRLATAANREVTRPNNDTLYSSAWLDLSDGPVTLRMPATDGRYWSIALMDPFTDNVACVSRRTSGSAERLLWIAPPGWTGAAPDGATALRMDCHDLWLLARILVDGPTDLSRVAALQNAMGMRGGGSGRSWRSAPSENDPSRFLAFANEALGRNPVLARDRPVLERVAAVGVVPGDLQAWDRLDITVRETWTRLWPTLQQRLRQADAAFRKGAGPGWMTGLDHIGNFGTDYEYRSRIALGGLGALERVEAMYATAYTDGGGQRLHGSRGYRLRVPGDLPVRGFWSLSMYQDDPDGRAFFVRNASDRFAIGDRTPGLQREADGSVELVIQRQMPEQRDERANWLPAPEGFFSLSWRLYEPAEGLLSGARLLPGVRPV